MYLEVLRKFRKRFLGKRLALFKSGQWHFHQDNAPVHNSVLWPINADVLTEHKGTVLMPILIK